jgi:hypothetical protein
MKAREQQLSRIFLVGTTATNGIKSGAFEFNATTPTSIYVPLPQVPAKNQTMILTGHFPIISVSDCG